MTNDLFTSEKKLKRRINEYFKIIDQHNDSIPEKLSEGKLTSVKTKKENSNIELPTITGLALHLDFNSLAEFDEYLNDGQFAAILKQAHLRIEAVYEKKLHLNQPHTGAIFALKQLGWGEKNKDNSGSSNAIIKTIQTEVIVLESIPAPAPAESEVTLYN